MPAHSNNQKTTAWLNAFSSRNGRKPWGSLLLSFVLVGVVGGLVWGANAFSSASQWVVHTNQARMDVQDILVAVNEAESAHRGYLLSGDATLRRQSLMAQGRALELSQSLPRLVSDNLQQKQNAERLRLLISARFSLIEDVAIVYQQQGFEKAHAKWLDASHRNSLAQQTRDLATKMVDEEYRLLLLRQARTRELALWVELMAFGGMSVAVALVILTGLAYRRETLIRDRATRATLAAHDELAASLQSIERDHLSTQALAEFASLLQGCNNIEEIFQVSVHSIAKILPGTAGTFYLMRASRDHAQAQADWGDYWRERPPSISPSQCWGLRQGRSFHADPTKLTCAHRLDAPIGHSTCVPMMVQGSEVGLLFIQHEEQWSGAAMAEAASEQLALAITNLRLRETLRTQSLRDPLTGLSNRRELDEHLPKEIARAGRAGQPLSLMVLDIDHFKRFNDTFGHDAGDAVLREFAHLLQKSMRTEDMVARLGGEEFIVVLSNTSCAQAQELAERLRKQVESMEVVHRGSSLGKITTSIGLAECPQHATDPQALVSTADAALYRAKNAGRNRIEIADGAPDLS